MKSTLSDESQKYLTLIKLDATSLINRIKERQSVYLETFSLKRDRRIFGVIFKNRYQKTTMFDLSHLPIEIIELAEDFYSSADELYWYLMNTQDMPNTIEDELIRHIHKLKLKYDVLCSYINAELSGTPLESIEDSKELYDNTSEFSNFLTDGEKEAIEQAEFSTDDALKMDFEDEIQASLTEESSDNDQEL